MPAKKTSSKTKTTKVVKTAKPKTTTKAEPKVTVAAPNNNLPIAIAFAAILIAGAIFFNGSNSAAPAAGGNMDAQIAAGVENYIQQQQEATRKAQEEANKPKKVAGVTAGGNAILGNPDAKVTIVEFSDYECPFCKRHFTDVLPMIKEKYVDTGKVNYVFRDFPLDFHDPIATQQAMAAECAGDLGGDTKYYEYHDLIFKTTTSNKGMEQSQLYELAAAIDLDAADFAECLDTEKFADEVAQDIADGKKFGVSGTPGFFINGWFIKGAFPYAEFERIIEEELALAN